MPNRKRTPAIAVCVICQSHEDSVSYPILIGKILRKKEPGSQNEQRYEGYNATLQALVFAPHGYYWESLSLMQKCTSLKGTLLKEKLELH